MMEFNQTNKNQGDVHNAIGPGPKPLSYEDLRNRFMYHAPKGDQPERYEKVRAAALSLASLLIQLCPPSRELSLSITHLEETTFWANAAIARNT